MSSTLKKLMTFLSSGLAVFGLCLLVLSEDPAQKEDFHQPLTMHFLEGKGQALILVKVQPTSEIAQDESDITELKATVQVQKNFPTNIQLAWDLPAEVELLEGNLISSLPPMSEGDSMDFFIKVKNFSQASRQVISARAYVNIAGTNLGSSAIISSQPEESYDILASNSFDERELASSEQLGHQKRQPAMAGKIIR
jgi:hypothetical protein